MRTSGRLTISLLAALALGALTASSAPADEWFIEDAKLAAGKSAALATAAPVDEFISAQIGAGSSSEVEIRCEGANLIKSGAYISGGTGGMANSVRFEDCKVTKPLTGCRLVGQPTAISTGPLGVTVLLAGPATKVRVNVHPLTKSTFTNINVAEGSTCLGGEGLKPITGSVFALSSNTGTESAIHTIMAQGSLENNSLEVAGDKIIISAGVVLEKLASGSKWSFHA